MVAPWLTPSNRWAIPVACALSSTIAWPLFAPASVSASLKWSLSTLSTKYV